MHNNQIELIPTFGMSYFIKQDLRNNRIYFDDYLKLFGLAAGDIIFLHDQSAIIPLIVGNCTPTIKPTSNDGGIGWDYSQIKNHKVLCVYGTIPNCGSSGSFVNKLS